jgi:hypothetical protein
LAAIDRRIMERVLGEIERFVARSEFRDEEAVVCADELGEAWTATPGAVPWIAAW